MLRNLMKVRLLEDFAFILRNQKTGKQRSKPAIVGLSVLFIFMLVSFSFMFVKLSDFLVEPYFAVNVGWLYFTLFGLMATAIGIFLSVFTVFSSIYQSKDNEFLLTLPIPPFKILISKIFSCYLMSFVFEAIVLIPCYVVFALNQTLTPLITIIGVINIFVLPLFALSISCILGWIIAVIVSKIKKNIRTIVTILIAIVFFGAYYYIMSDVSDFLNLFIILPDEIAGFTKYAFYPIYAYGHGSLGDIKSLLIYLAVVIGLFAIVCFVLSKTFISIATKNKGSNVKKFEKQSLNSSSIDNALLKREFTRLTSSPVYILNCCMGCILTVLAIFFTILKRDMLLMIPSDYAGIIACVVIASITPMNDITAPSISLEGKTLWILQTLPVDSWTVLKSKIKIHMLISSIPLLVLVGVIEVIFDMTLISRIMLPVYAVLFPFFEAVFGLMINLKMPNLNWTNEAAAVKQGINVLIALLGGLGIIIILAVPYIIWNDIFSADIYIILTAIVILIATIILWIWLKKKGSEIFNKL